MPSIETRLERLETIRQPAVSPVTIKEVYTMPDGREVTPANGEAAADLRAQGGQWDVVITVGQHRGGGEKQCRGH